MYIGWGDRVGETLMAQGVFTVALSVTFLALSIISCVIVCCPKGATARAYFEGSLSGTSLMVMILIFRSSD
jgi:hypothetical protein